MREFQAGGVFVTAANGNYTFGNTASGDLLHSSSDTEMRSPLSTGSHFSVLTAASSTLSIVSQTHQQCDWPEFEESYNSIMDNTNLLDSCAAALHDISGDEKIKRREKMRYVFNRSLSSTTTNSSFSGNEKPVTSKRIEQFTRWLCEMENRVAAQPKLSKIVAMQPKQMDQQLKMHSEIFKEIVAQPCIVKGSKRSEYKAIEERYHLLYLKVYEVLLLLEGMPANSYSPSNHILSESYQDFGSSSSTNSKEHPSDHIDGNNELLNDVLSNKSDTELVKTPIYTETNVLSTSIGTYYFNYDDSIEQQTGDNENAKLSSTIFEHSDKEFTFENDLQTLFNASDSICLKSADQTLVSEHRAFQHPVVDDTVLVSQKSARIWKSIDFCELAAYQSVGVSSAGNCHTKDIDLAHHKVYNWLNSKTNSCKSSSTLSLDCCVPIESDYQLLYRAKSEMDLPAIRSIGSNHRTSPTRTSLNCLLPNVRPVKYIETAFSDTVTEDNSLLWDSFQIGDFKPEYDYGLTGSDAETKEMVSKLCYFGDDYSDHLSLHLAELSTAESEKECDTGIEQSSYGKSDPNITESLSPSSTPLPLTSKKLSKSKRSHRARKKRTRNISEVTSSSTSSEYHSSKSMDRTSEAGQSAATTASANSKLLSFSNDKSTQTHDDTTDESNEKFVPEQTISYNNIEKQFELHSKESVEPKKMKINEMRPKDFFDIVKMCHSNIDCVITVLGADPNRILTVDYCQQMKLERYQKSNSGTCKCKHENADASDLVKSSNKNTINSGSSSISPRTKDTNCNCSHVVKSEAANMCVCAWVSHTIAMILNFLIDCWNIFRNMKLYTYLCRVAKALFGSTRYAADHLKSKSQMLDAKAIKYA